jgi:hypothetical protein
LQKVSALSTQPALAACVRRTAGSYYWLLRHDMGAITNGQPENRIYLSTVHSFIQTSGSRRRGKRRRRTKRFHEEFGN